MAKLAALEHIKACAEAAKKFTGDLVSELAQTTLDALKEMNEAKANSSHKHETVDISDFPDSIKPTSHASAANTYGAGDASNFGHVKLSDSTGDSSAASSGIAATPKAVKAAYDLANGKADKGSGVSVTIPASGWGSDSTAMYSKYYDISVTEVTTKDRADVLVSPTGMATAVACGLCPVTETLAGKIRIRAVSVPSSTIAAQYWVEKGA